MQAQAIVLAGSPFMLVLQYIYLYRNEDAGADSYFKEY